MNLPNILTVSRFFLSYWMVYFIFDDGGTRALWALPIFIAGAVTDYLDGKLARMSGKLTVFGSLMDPIADKTLTLCAFVSFWKLDLLPGLWVAVVAARDAAMTGYRLFQLGKGQGSSKASISAKASGKWKTAVQMVYIGLVLAYLGVQGQFFWSGDWNGAVEEWIHGGMFLIVALSLWSAIETLRKP